MSDQVTPAAETPAAERPAKAPRAAALKAELEAARAKLEAELAPARAFHDAHVNDPKFLAAKATIKRVNAALFPILSDLAVLARAKGSKGILAEPGGYAAE